MTTIRSQLLGAALLVSPVKGSLIHWVTDNGAEGTDGNGAFEPSGAAAYPDEAWIDLLRAAGHTITRYNPPASGLLSDSDLSALNAGDLVILGRGMNSTPLQNTGANVQAPQWNVSITVPMLVQSAFLTRNNRLGWFTSNTIADTAGSDSTVSATLIATDPASELFCGITLVEVNGAKETTTAFNVPPADAPAGHRGTSVPPASLNGTVNATQPVAGGVVLATSQGNTLDATTGVLTANTFTGYAVVEWPAGTPVRGGADVFGGYRMLFCSGGREANGQATTEAGREDLSLEGERIFLNAVNLTLRSGADQCLTGPPVIIDYALAPPQFSLTIGTTAGVRYQLQRSSILATPWTDVGAPQTGTGAPLTLIDSTGASGPRMFWRATIAP